MGNLTHDRDSGKVLRFPAKAPPKHEALTVAVLNPRFIIPPGDANHRVDAAFKLKRDAHLLGFMPPARTDQGLS